MSTTHLKLSHPFKLPQCVLGHHELMTANINIEFVPIRKGGDLGGPTSNHTFFIVHDWNSGKTWVGGV